MSLTKQQLWRAVPDGDDTVGVVELVVLSIEACQTKISKLEDTLIADQDVCGLDVAVQDTPGMQVVKTLEELLCQVLLMAWLQLVCRMIEETRQIMGQVLEYHVAFIILNHDLQKLDHVLVAKRAEQLDLTNRGDREAIPFALHPDSLQSHELLSVDIHGFEDLAVCTRANDRLIAWFPEEDGFGSSQVRRKLRLLL